VVFYPYSGARNLLSEVGRFTAKYTLDIKKFCDVFEHSLNDMDNALRQLLITYDFYRIKNLIFIHKKPVVITPNTVKTYADFCMDMKKKKIGQIAREEIPLLIDRKPFLANDLLNENYCQTTFSTPVSVLSNTQVYLPCGDGKYYAKPMVSANGHNYYLFMHWREENHRKNLLDWLWANR
jgi:hypothetical protein